GTARASSSSFRSSVVAPGTDGGSGSSGGSSGGNGATAKRVKGTVRASSSSVTSLVVAPGTEGGSGSGSGGGATVTVVKKRGRGRPRKVKPVQKAQPPKEEEAAQPRVGSTSDDPSVDEMRAHEETDKVERPVIGASASEDKPAPPDAAPTRPASEAAASMEDTASGKLRGQASASEDTSAPPRQVEETASPKGTTADEKAGKATCQVVGPSQSNGGVSAPSLEEEEEE
ncbi:unnamed protein product, partial [Ectocarpus sp. 12 AP-2014]